MPGFSCATLLCALFLSGPSSHSSSTAVDGSVSGHKKGKSQRHRASPAAAAVAAVAVAAAPGVDVISACESHSEFKDNGSSSSSDITPGPRAVSPRQVNTPRPAAAAGFEFLVSLTFSHCKWHWTVESLLLFAYLLNVSRTSVSNSEAVGTSTSTSSEVSSSLQKHCGHLSNLRVINIQGSDLFEPPAGFSALSKADKIKLRETCALFRSICNVKLSVDGVSDDSEKDP
jgi:hypothetical protein